MGRATRTGTAASGKTPPPEGYGYKPKSGGTGHGVELVRTAAGKCESCGRLIDTTGQCGCS